LYAILDIETTGGKFNEEGITEIAIYKFNGHEIIDQFASLVNPEIPIQPFVVKLTGISNKMLRSAPKFFEVAKRIIEITEGCTIVAHNSSFDYRILKLEFGRLGYVFERKTLDTVSLSKSLIPDMDSYSLGKLCDSLGIPITDRHRATGDALATVKLFKILLNKDSGKEIIKNSIIVEKRDELTSKFVAILRDLPSSTGVYYVHKKGGDIIFIGKSKNIKKRINQHFLNKSSRAKKMQNEIVAISYEETGSELIALLKEFEEIETNLPKYNRIKRKSKFTYGLYYFSNDNGYIQFSIEKVRTDKEPLISFISIAEGEKVLDDLRDKYRLCMKLTDKHKIDGACSRFEINECDGACIGEESAKDYNRKIDKIIRKYSFENTSFAIVDNGRHPNEKSVILVENGIYKGFAFVDLDSQITNTEILKSRITPMKHNVDVKNIIQSYLRRRKVKKIINLNNK